MNDRERILTLLKGGQPDRVSWFGDLTYWAGAMEARGEVPAGFQQTQAYYDFHRELGVGFYLQGYWPFKEVYDETITTRQWSDDAGRHRIIETPVGRLEERWTRLPDSFTDAPSERLIRSPSDLATLRYLHEHTTYEPDYEEAERRYARVEDLGIVLCYTPRSPLMQLVAVDAGVETVVTCILEAEDEFRQTLDVMEASLDRAVQLAIESPAECLMIPENLSSEVVGKRLFEDYMRERQEKWTRRIHEAGKFSFIHIDGSLRGLLAEEGAIGFTVLEALTQKPVGDVPMAELRGLAGPTSILWGGLPGSYFTPLVSDAEFERLIREVLDVMRRDGRCVLGAADQVPPDGLRDRVARVVELVETYGRYA